MSRVPALKGITIKQPLDRNTLSACFPDEAQAAEAWEAYQKLVELVKCLRRAKNVPRPLAGLMSMEVIKLDSGDDGLPIGDLIRIACLAQATQLRKSGGVVYVQAYTGKSWEKVDQCRIIQLRDVLYDNLPKIIDPTAVIDDETFMKVIEGIGQVVARRMSTSAFLELKLVQLVAQANANYGPDDAPATIRQLEVDTNGHLLAAGVVALGEDPEALQWLRSHLMTRTFGPKAIEAIQKTAVILRDLFGTSPVIPPLEPMAQKIKGAKAKKS